MDQIAPPCIGWDRSIGMLNVTGWSKCLMVGHRPKLAVGWRRWIEHVDGVGSNNVGNGRKGFDF